ncbi:MAG TPA: hypothetical protein VLL97_11030 [Acidobacteriota bacterium]|nr:hypothetical protein [Acidobacteriota bacterium]
MGIGKIFQFSGILQLALFVGFMLVQPAACAPENMEAEDKELQPPLCDPPSEKNGAAEITRPAALTFLDRPLTAREKTAYYLKLYGPASISTSVFIAGMNQARDRIPEWGQGMAGYGRRFSSTYGQKAINRSIRFGMQYLLKEDPRYRPSGNSGFFNRALHAVSRRFISNKDQGGTRPGYSYFLGLAGGVYISRQWHPPAHRTVSGYISSAAIVIGIDAMLNMFQEFKPELRILFQR